MRESFKSNEKFRGLVEEISDGIIALDDVWKIVYANRTAEKLLNRNRETLLDKNIWQEFPESVGGKFYQAYHQAFLSQDTLVVDDYSSVLGKWLKAKIYPAVNGITIYFHDITSQKKSEERADKIEENYRQFIDRITDGFIVLDKHFNYVYVNKQIGQLVHRDPQSLIGKNMWEEFPDAVGSLTHKAFQTAFKEQRFISNIDYFEPLNLWQENYIYPSPEGLSVFIRDITDRKKLETELRKKEKDQQFELMITALEAQEKERTHIGRELHDNVNQLLVATKLMLAILRDDPARMSEAIMNRCVGNLEKAIEENRKISHELVTPDLKEETLVEQVKQLMQTMFAANNIEVVINASGFKEPVLDEPRKLAVYRIAQEQCTNIIKYAKAKKVTLALSSNNEEFKMTITDDGMGMIKAKTAAGIGLKNMTARARYFDGSVQVATKPGKGFKLQVTLPVVTAAGVPSLNNS